MKTYFVPVALFICLNIAIPSAAQQSNNAGLGYLHHMETERNGSKTLLYKIITGTTTPVSFGVPLTFYVTGLINKDDRLKKYALFSLENLVITETLTFAAKKVINKPRPFKADSTLITLQHPNDGSLPSGHTSEAFATATTLALIYPKWYVIVPAYTWAGYVGYSRLYLGVHYPSDVIAGAILGAGSSWVNYKLNKWMHKDKTKHKFSLFNGV